MKLREALATLYELPETATLFVERRDGRFAPESNVTIYELTGEEKTRPIVDVAAERARGKEYFLELYVVREIIEGWRHNHRGCSPSVDEALESVIFYAENDAYPSSFFGDA